MSRFNTILLTAIAPILWGTTYITTTELLPPHHPLLTAMLRALPAGLLLTALQRQLPRGGWWWRAAVLGALNIGICFAMLFIAAYRLPGGVAATIGAIQPLLVALLGWPLLQLRPVSRTIVAGLFGIAGVGMLVLGASARMDPLGSLAAIGAAVSMASGVVLAKRWGRPDGMSVLAFTGWQLTAGGLLLLPFWALFEGAPRAVSVQNVGGYLYLGLIGTAFAYTIWFRGLAALPAASVSFLSLLIPLVATLLGFVAYHQSLTPEQAAGMALVIGSIVVAQRVGAARSAAARPVQPSTIPSGILRPVREAR